MTFVAGLGQSSLIPKLYLPMLAIIAGALFLRLFGITIIGVGGNDTIL